MDIVEVFRRGLEQKGLQVDAYSSPQEALRSFKPNMYDLAILDIRMPVMSGFELYREMKKVILQLWYVSFLLLKYIRMSPGRYFLL